MLRHTDEDFIDKESITIASVLAFQATGIYWPELDAPETVRFTVNTDATFSEEIFNEWSGIPAVD